MNHFEMKKDWIIREEDDKFNKGDLVLVKQYSCYDLSNPFGHKNDEFSDFSTSEAEIEELLVKENVCLGIVTSKEILSWEPDAELWMTAVSDKPYMLVQFRVYCFGQKGEVRTKIIDSTAMRLISRGDISNSVKESLENLTNNNK